MKGIKNAVGDLSSLEVITVTGNLNAKIQPDATGSNKDKGSLIDWKKLIKGAKAQNSTVNLKLASRYEFNGDATLSSPMVKYVRRCRPLTTKP
ncbi:MAG: hypothetical protein AAF333_04755 [Planctomycetota bacterium]